MNRKLGPLAIPCFAVLFLLCGDGLLANDTYPLKVAFIVSLVLAFIGVLAETLS